MNKKQLLPCGCGGEAYHDSASCWNPEEEEWMPNFWHRVICKNCGTQTKPFYTENEAIEAWNLAMRSDKYEHHIDHTDCIWYWNGKSRCPSTCSQYRDGWNDAMNYIFKNGKGYNPYQRGDHE